jgi:hypothetical protein
MKGSSEAEMKDLRARISSVRVNPAPQGFFAASFSLLLVAVICYLGNDQAFFFN